MEMHNNEYQIQTVNMVAPSPLALLGGWSLLSGSELTVFLGRFRLPPAERGPGHMVRGAA